MNVVKRTKRGRGGVISAPGLATILVLSGAVASAQAGELVFGAMHSGLGKGTRLHWGDAQLTLKGAVNAGSVWREGEPMHSLTDAKNVMNTLNDGDLNYKRGDTISRAVDTYLQGNLEFHNLGLFVSTKAWYDDALMHHDVPHGSVANGYQSGKPLSDVNFVPLERFSNLVLDDAYVYGHFRLGQQKLLVRAGNQVIPWVTPTTIGGGLQEVNAIDYAAIGRASAIPEEFNIPAPALYAKWTLTPNFNMDAFAQFRFEPNAYPGCGTFWSTSDFAQPGCDKLTLNGAVLSAIAKRPVMTTDAQSATNPLDYVARGRDSKPENPQFGFSVHYLLSDVGILGAYYANYTSRAPLTQLVRTGPGVLVPAAANLGRAVPTGLASYYTRAYQTHIHLFGLNLETRLPDGTGIYAEYTYRPNMPIAWNGAAFEEGVLGGKGPLAYLYSTPTGYVARGYDRFKVSQFNLGASKMLGRVLGGQAKLSAEAAVKYVHNLPDPKKMPYGRVGFGMAPSQADPNCSGSTLTCRVDGFVTRLAWGVRMKFAERYTDVVNGLTLTPSLSLAYDVKGYSYDGVFSQGRHVEIAQIRGDYLNRYVFRFSYLHTGGGDYNVVADRSFAMLSAGIKF